MRPQIQPAILKQIQPAGPDQGNTVV